MAVTLIKTPIGHKLSDSEIDAVIIDSAGDALVYMDTGHALNDGDYVYIQSNFDAYNGYKYVDSIAYDSFKIKDSANSDYVEYVQDADITYQVSVLNHGWQAVHNPIVYELESDIYPNNVAEEEYTPITIVNYFDYGGLTRLTLSSGLASINELDKVQLFGNNPAAGIYQIVTLIDPWNFVIDLEYDVSFSVSSLQVIRRYDNYTINVNVYAGIEPGHRWETTKPFELAATLSFIPDNDNKVKFSISEVLRSYITTRNNLTLDTLPNNLDFMVAFYIEYYETHDDSDGEEITTFTGDVTEDDFIGYAVNAMMPFKSESISHMNDYINEDVYLAQWLSVQTRPIAVVDRFFDLSFINQYNNKTLYAVIDKSLNGVVTESETITIENPGNGIIRVPLTPSSGFDEYCVQVWQLNSDGFTPATLPDYLTWSNRNDAGPIWTVMAGGPVLPGVGSNTNSLGLGVTSDKWYTPYTFEDGRTYSFDYTFVANAGVMTFYISILDSGYGVLISTSLPLPPTPGIYSSGTYTFSAPVGATYISIHFFSGTSCGSSGYGCYGFIKAFTNATATIPATPDTTITERICIDIIEECESTFIPSDDNIRLTEGGDFRILE